MTKEEKPTMSLEDILAILEAYKTTPTALKKDNKINKIEVVEVGGLLQIAIS